MKKTIFAAILPLLALASCNTDSKTSAEEALALNGTLKTDYGLEWQKGNEIGIIPVAAKTDPAGDGSAVRVVTSEFGKTAKLEYTGTKFIAESSIQTHKFVGFSPYHEGVTDASAIPVAVPSLQTQSSANNFDMLAGIIPLYGKASLDSPMSGSVVRIEFVPAAAVVKIPVVTGENMASKVTISVPEDAPYLCATEATLNSNDGKITVTTGLRSIEVKISTPLPASVDTQYVYAAVLPGDFSGKILTGDVLTEAGHVKLTFQGGNYEAGKMYELKGVRQGEDGLKVNVSTIAFDKSYIYDVLDKDSKVVAKICKEYLGKTVNQQAVVAYGLTADGKIDADAGLVACVTKAATAPEYMNYSDVLKTEKVHGGIFSLASDGYTTPGASEALDNVYVSVNADGSTSVFAEAPAKTVDAAVAPSVLVLGDREDTYAYKTVKIGKFVMMAENLKTTKLPDKTDITSPDADSFKNDSQPDTETGCKPRCIIYNGDVYYNGYCAGAFPIELGSYSDKSTMPNVIAPDGWKVPTGSANGDWGVLTKFVGASSQLDIAGNNITLFSSKFIGRATQGTYADTAGTIYWSASLNWKSSKVQGYFLKITEGGTATAPAAGSGTTLFNGFAIRLIKKNAVQTITK